MTQLKYVWRDFVNNKRVTVIFLIQMVFFYLIIASTIASILASLSGLKAVEKISDSSTYMLSDYTTEKRQQSIFENQEDSLPLVRQLFNSIVHSNVPFYSQYSYVYYDNYDGIEIQQYTANRGFFEIFNIEYAAGSGFSQEDYAGDCSDVIPIVVGYKLQDYYQLGKTYDLLDCGSGTPITCKVVGILKNNSVFYNLYFLNKPVNLNYSFIKPLMDQNISSMSFSDIDMAISSSVFFTENDKPLQDIATLSQNLGLFSYKVETTQNAIDWYVSNVIEQVEYQLSIALIILLFAGIGMSTNLTLMFTKGLKEYSIHMLCGCRQADLIKRFLIYAFILNFVAIIPAIVVFGFNLTILYTLLISLFVSIVVVFPTLKTIFSTSTSDMLRRSE